MKERIKRTLSLLAIPVVLLMLTGVALAGTVHNVGKGTLYPDIQGAINDADPGNQINIDSGTYYENINVDKENLILNGVDTGTGKPVIDGGGNGNTITLSAKGITLAGFSVINAGSGWPGAGINVISNNNNIENNDASGNRNGIYLANSNGNKLSHNDVLNNQQSGILLDSGSAGNQLTGNKASFNLAEGISVYYGSSNTLNGNEASNNLNGIGVYYSSSNVVTNNVISSNTNTGMTLGFSSANSIYLNNFIGNAQNGYDDSATANSWDNGAQGNYWNDRTGPDADGNGIVDTPYIIPGAGAEDRYPSTKAYSEQATPLTAKIISPTSDEKFKRGRTIDDLVDVSFKGIAEGGKPDYTFVWYLDGSEIPQQGQGVSYPVSYGKHILKLTVTDSTGIAADSSEVNFEIATTIAVVPVKLGFDSYKGDDNELNARMDDLRNYYYQQSYHKENVITDLKVGWSSAKSLGMNPDEYRTTYNDPEKYCDGSKSTPCSVQLKDRALKQIALDATEGIDLGQYNAVVVVFASDAASEDNFVPVSCNSNSRYPDIGGDIGTCGNIPYSIIPENRMSNVWVHELGHSAFDFTDKYGCSADGTDCSGGIGGNIGFWGIMGAGSEAHGVDPLYPVDPISKHEAHWIDDIWKDEVWDSGHQLKTVSHQPINLVSDKGIYSYKSETGSYDYIIEGRNPPDGGMLDSWCASGSKPCKAKYIDTLKQIKGVLLYDYHRDASVGGTVYKTDKIYSMRNRNPTILDSEAQNTVTLVPDSLSKIFDDPSTDTRFLITEENGQLYLDISKLSIDNENIIMMGDYILPYDRSSNAYVSTQNIPDIDLKVYNSAGQMVGMNYTSGMYEVGINEVNTSGNMYGGMEWIAYPNSMNDIYAVLDTTPLKKWAEEVNVTLSKNITVPLHMVLYDSNGTRIETAPVNITIDTANPVKVVQTSELLPDTTSPIITFTTPLDGMTVLLNENMNAIYTVGDNGSGVKTVDSAVPNRTRINTSTVGIHSITVNATDNAGNLASKTISYRVVYNKLIMIQPINEDNTSVIKRGSVTPVKIRITDANGNNVTNAVVRINITWLNSTILGTEVEASTVGNANTDGFFRFSPDGNLYIYNWGTKDLELGTYKITIRLDDGSTKEVLVGLRK